VLWTYKYLVRDLTLCRLRTVAPTCTPSTTPTLQPSPSPRARPTATPSEPPSRFPTTPSLIPTARPTMMPTESPTANPTVHPQWGLRLQPRPRLKYQHVHPPRRPSPPPECQRINLRKHPQSLRLHVRIPEWYNYMQNRWINENTFLVAPTENPSMAPPATPSTADATAPQVMSSSLQPLSIPAGAPPDVPGLPHRTWRSSLPHRASYIIWTPVVFSDCLSACLHAI